MDDFNKRLKEALQLRNLTQSDLCELTGIPKSAMSQYVSGAFIPKQERTYLIAQALDISEGWLMGYDVPMERIKFDKSTLDLLREIGDRKYEDMPIITSSGGIGKSNLAKAIVDLERKRDNELKLSLLFDQLNELGQQEAIKRVKELTYLPDYKK